MDCGLTLNYFFSIIKVPFKNSKLILNNNIQRLINSKSLLSYYSYYIVHKGTRHTGVTTVSVQERNPTVVVVKT